MKKYNILLAMIALVLSSLACQTIMGGGRDEGYETPVYNDDSAPTSTSGDDVDSGDVTVGGDSEFPTPSDAFNVVSAPDTVVFQTKLSSDDVIKFYQDEFGNLGYTEDPSMAVNFSGAFTMGFDGHESGRKIVIGGAPAGDGSTAVTITLQ
jgi:hypothetical protein